MQSKKSQVSATLTWIVAFVIIAFIIILYLSIAAGIAGKRNIPILSEFYSKSSLEVDTENKNDYSANTILQSYLNSPVDYQGKSMKMSDFIVFAQGNIFSVKKTSLTVAMDFRGIRDSGNYEQFIIFYEKSANYFDKIYDKCYVLCLFKPSIESTIKKEPLLFYPPRVVGKNCPTAQGVKEAVNIELYGRQPDNYNCNSLASASDSSRLFDSAEALEVEGGIQIKLFAGSSLFPEK